MLPAGTVLRKPVSERLLLTIPTAAPLLPAQGVLVARKLPTG